MNGNKIFLATSGSGLARAECGENGAWSVTFVLEDEAVGCVTAVPQNPATLYAGTQGNGVLRSDDRGQTWQPSGLSGQIVKSLAVSSHDPNIIYAGTKPALLFKSIDGGKSWAELESFRRIRGYRFWFSPAEPPDKRPYVQAITISPTQPDVLLAGIEFGAVVRSEDGGQSWSNHLKGSLRDCHNLKFHATDGDWLYEAGGGGAAVGRGNGRFWQKANVNLKLSQRYGVACAADPQRPEVWYVSVTISPSQAYGKQAKAYLFRASGDAGWQPIGWQDHPLPQMPIALVTDPAAPGHLYAGLTYGDVWHSVDYGDTWQKLPFNLGQIWRSMIMI